MKMNTANHSNYVTFVINLFLPNAGGFQIEETFQ
jgi:hypothetical protein